MIKIKMGQYSMEAEGHAGYAEFGKDIVCAGVSCLAHVLGEAVLEMEAAGQLLEEPEIMLCPGQILIRCMPSCEMREKAGYLFSMVGKGCRLLANTYPDYVMIADPSAE